MNERAHKQRWLHHTGVLSWLRLARVYHKIDMASARHFKAHELSTAQFDTLAQIGAHEGITQQELAGALLVTKGNVSQLVDRMERQGLVRRCQEGRKNTLYLTDDGRRLFEAVVPAQEALVAALFAPLSPAEQSQLLGLLRKLDHGLE
jgi:DNA-binding MarR family transcriptional regulator